MPDPRQPMLSVWPTGQLPHRYQRTGRYRAASFQHPARMLPDIARHAIQQYTRPGDLILDPMCGIGTTLVEAVHLGRDAIGVDLEPRWVELTERNLAYALTTGATGHASVTGGDARQLPSLLAPLLHRPAALVLTSPPYGPWVHGLVRTERDRGGDGGPVDKWAHRYTTSPNPADLARMPTARRHDAMAQILAAAASLLAPGGIVVLTARPWRQGAYLVDFPGDLIGAAQAAGLTLIDRAAALLAGFRDNRVVSRTSFFALHNVRTARDRGQPIQVIAHEDILAFQRIQP